MRQCATGKRIKEMPANSITAQFPKVINEISLITGLKVDPENFEPFALLFSKFLIAHYGLLTCEEITLAFRLNAAGDLEGVNDRNLTTDKIALYGPFLTIEHIGSVLFRYMQKRGNLARKINEQPQKTIEPPPPTKEQQEMDDKQFCNEYYRKYLNQEFSTVTMEYAYMVYDILDRLRIIQLSVQEKNKYFAEAQKIREQELSAPAISFSERKDQNKLMEAYLNDEIPQTEQQLVKNYAKRLVLFDMFKAWKEHQRRAIFEL